MNISAPPFTTAYAKNMYFIGDCSKEGAINKTVDASFPHGLTEQFRATASQNVSTPPNLLDSILDMQNNAVNQA